MPRAREALNARLCYHFCSLPASWVRGPWGKTKMTRTKETGNRPIATGKTGDRTRQDSRKNLIRLSLALLTVLAVWLLWPTTPERPQSSPAPMVAELIEEETGPAEPDSETLALGTARNDDAAATYEARSRYPSSTRRLSDDSFDLLNPGARYETRQRIPNSLDKPDPNWSVLFTADRYFLTGEESAKITLKLWHGDDPIELGRVEMTAEALTENGSTRSRRLEVVQIEEGVQALLAPNQIWPELAGALRVTAQFEADELMRQSGTLDFHFTGSKRIPAQFTGSIDDRIIAGNLAFDLGLDVRAPGRYRIEGNLFDVSGKPFGWARFDGRLDKGKQSAMLVYDGLLFHDAEAQGPYLLTQIRGRRLMPESRVGSEWIPELGKDYLTQSDYQLMDFRDTVWISPRRLKLMEMMEDARRRGVPH